MCGGEYSTCIFTKLNLKHAYHLVCVALGDKWKMAFQTHYGSFEWLVMPFGLTNAPSVFQRFVNENFANLLDVYILVYLDDILIFSDNMADHKKHAKEVLRCLQEQGLFVNGDKCCFHSDSVEYLGYIIGSGGLCMDSAKVQVIQDWPKPKKVKDVQSFLGFANFYRRFIHGYSEIVLSLTCLTQKATLWNFDDNCHFAFQTLKNAFITALLSSKFGQRCWVQSHARHWLKLVGCAALLMDASNFGGPESSREEA